MNRQNLEEALSLIRIVNEELSKQRFVGTDQNPFGIRDMLVTAMYKLKDELSKLE